MAQTYSAATDVRLRPLSTGEIFDRAITLFVRNLPPFIIVSAFVAVPMAIGQYFISLSGAGWVQQVLQQTQHPGKTVPTPPANPSIFIVFLALLMQPFCYVALAALVGRLYHGDPLDWRAAYAVAFRRTGGIILTILAAMGVYVGFVLVFMIVVGFGILISAALFRGFAPLGVVTTVITLAAALAALLWGLLMFLALGLAFNAIGIEQTPAGTAIGEGFARVFDRNGLKKAILIVLALVAVQMGAIVVSLGLQGVSEAVFHSALLDGALSGALTLFSGAFFGVLLGVYYFDVRVRREGLDVEAELDRLTTQPQG